LKSLFGEWGKGGGRLGEKQDFVPFYLYLCVGFNFIFIKLIMNYGIRIDIMTEIFTNLKIKSFKICPVYQRSNLVSELPQSLNLPLRISLKYLLDV
jgi:hypothetical protein